jgi:hypothetical protein
MSNSIGQSGSEIRVVFYTLWSKIKDRKKNYKRLKDLNKNPKLITCKSWEDLL